MVAASHPLVSVIIPVYNSEKYLGECIDSVLKQGYAELEVILIDDGSVDSSPAICDRYASMDKRVRVAHLPNGGVSRARNKGLAIAVGEYITFMDSDDSLEADAIASYVKAANDYDADIVRGGYVREYTESGRTEVVSGKEDVAFDSPAAYHKWLEKNQYYSFVWNSFTRRAIIADMKFREDLRWLEDHTFFYAVYPRCRKMVALSKPVYHYYVRNSGGNLSDVRDAATIWDAADAELTGKLSLCEGIDNEMEQEAWTRYGFLLEKFVSTIYSQKYARKERKTFAMLRPKIKALPLRHSRIFFNTRVPFFFRDALLKTIYTLKDHK